MKRDPKLSDRIYHCNVCKHTMDRDLNVAINIRNMGLIKIGRGTPEFTSLEIEALLEMVTRVNKTRGSLP
ncbi:MAG: zinc ribbon domain-containing protein [Thermoplasmataceae archaeon]